MEEQEGKGLNTEGERKVEEKYVMGKWIEKMEALEGLRKMWRQIGVEEKKKQLLNEIEENRK